MTYIAISLQYQQHPLLMALHLISKLQQLPCFSHQQADISCLVRGGPFQKARLVL